MKYRKRGVVVAAEQWFRKRGVVVEAEQWFPGKEVDGVGPFGHIETSGHRVDPGDWIITGVAGEKHSCKPELFAATYEPEEAPPISLDSLNEDVTTAIFAAEAALDDAITAWERLHACETALALKSLDDLEGRIAARGSGRADAVVDILCSLRGRVRSDP
jgi:hypothetical protein